MVIDFKVWAPSEQVFWDSWIAAGIATAPRTLAPGYTGMIWSDQTSQGWVPTKATGNTVVDPMGNTVPERVPVAGWHANFRVYSPELVAMFTHGLNQHDENGQLLPLFDRTWAKEVFQLTEEPANAETGFPAGFRNSVGVTYVGEGIVTPANHWA